MACFKHLHTYHIIPLYCWHVGTNTMWSTTLWIVHGLFVSVAVMGVVVYEYVAVRVSIRVLLLRECASAALAKRVLQFPSYSIPRPWPPYRYGQCFGFPLLHTNLPHVLVWWCICFCFCFKTHTTVSSELRLYDLNEDTRSEVWHFGWWSFLVLNRDCWTRPMRLIC